MCVSAATEVFKLPAVWPNWPDSGLGPVERLQIGTQGGSKAVCTRILELHRGFLEITLDLCDH